MTSRRQQFPTSVITSALALVTAIALPACGGDKAGGAGVAVLQSKLARDTSPTVPAADATELATGNRAFAVDLYQKLRARGGNIVVSPTSISVALAMLYNGAANATATQMASALHFTLPIDRLNAAFDALDLSIAIPPSGEAGSFQLSLANSTWTQRGSTLCRRTWTLWRSAMDRV